ncbi:MAG: hypothetical protein GY866_04640 [Proteobacteria bacterium]|nr:hypothetical protein [Pseudomonadota bacterium]
MLKMGNGGKAIRQGVDGHLGYFQFSKSDKYFFDALGASATKGIDIRGVYLPQQGTNVVPSSQELPQYPNRFRFGPVGDRFDRTEKLSISSLDKPSTLALNPLDLFE